MGTERNLYVMNHLKRILIADADSAKRQELADLFAQQDDFELLAQTDSGAELVRLTQQLKPDAVLLELVLADLDGIAALEQLREYPDPPRTIVVSTCTGDVMADIAAASGADYFMLRPVDCAVVCSRTRQLIERTQEQLEYQRALTVQISAILRELSLPVHVRGYQYAREAILMAVQDIEVLSGVTKVIYPDIARRSRTTPTRVERAIRHAVEIIWTRGRHDILRRYFSHLAEDERPTNSEFIAVIADHIRLERGLA